MFTTSILYRARSLFLGMFAAAVICTGAAGASGQGTNGAGAPAQQRPIEDFVSTQGSFFGDPFAILSWTAPAQELFTVVDYAGTIDSFMTALTGGAVSFGTQISGKVTERALPDGRAEVHVRLKTTNAWCFAVDYTMAFPDGVIFGNDPGATLMGAEPGLGTSHLHLRFTNTAPGDPLPDLLQLLLAPAEGQALLYMQFIANAEGPLDDGLVMTPPDGTYGCLHTTQLSPIVPDNEINGGVVAEFIDITEGACE